MSLDALAGLHVMTRRVVFDPIVKVRGEQPYVAVRGVVSLETVNEIADRLPEVFEWLGERGLEAVDAPFLRYRFIEMPGRLEVEAGVPVAGGVTGGDEVMAEILPAGRYVSVTHFGRPEGLVGVIAELLRWGGEHRVSWDVVEADDGQQWGCRLEVFRTNPAEQPNPDEWGTELLFRLADDEPLPS